MSIYKMCLFRDLAKIIKYLLWCESYGQVRLLHHNVHTEKLYTSLSTVGHNL